MSICDEDKGRAEIATLGRDGKNLLSHHIRNGMMVILAVSDCPKKVAEAVWELEKRMREVGL